jgi:hypothetical protein
MVQVVQMKWKSEFTVRKTVLISRLTFWLFFGFFLLAGLISEAAEIDNLKWLKLVPPFVGGISLVLLVISWITPGILILMGLPWLARAWHRGINPILDSDIPWEQLSNAQKFLTYFWSLLISGFTLLAIIGLIIQAIRK